MNCGQGEFFQEETRKASSSRTNLAGERAAKRLRLWLEINLCKETLWVTLLREKVYCSQSFEDNANEITLWGYSIYIKEMFYAAQQDTYAKWFQLCSQAYVRSILVIGQFCVQNKIERLYFEVYLY